MPPMRAASKPRRNGSRGSFSVRCSAAQSVELNGVDLGAARFSNVAGLLAMPIFNAGRTRAINEIAESGQTEALLRYEDGIVRALEDVENALVALEDERQRAGSLQSAAAVGRCRARPRAIALRPRADRSPAVARCAARRGWPCGSARTTAHTQLLLDSVQLYKALGGGWQVFEPVTDAGGSRRCSSAKFPKLPDRNKESS